MPLQPNLYLRGCQGVNNGKISAQKQKPSWQNENKTIFGGADLRRKLALGGIQKPRGQQ